MILHVVPEGRMRYRVLEFVPPPPRTRTMLCLFQAAESWELSIFELIMAGDDGLAKELEN